MKFGLIVIATLVASAFAAHFLLQDPGYVVINFRSYLIEMSVPVLIAMILFLLVLVWMILKLIRAPRRLGEAAGRYRSGQSGKRLTKGMIEIAEGNFAKGERLLARTAHRSDAPLLNYLQAARAAHLLGHDERRDNWLRQAYEQTPEAANAVLLTQAELQLDRDQYEQALATLRKLEENAPNHGRALVLLGRLYFQLEDWKNLGKLLPKLKKHARMEPATLEDWLLRVHSEKLMQAADGNTLDITWQAIPKADRKNDALRDTYFASLIRTGMHEKAEKELTKELKRNWRGPLVRLYGLVEGPDVTRQLKRAEAWLRDRGEDAELLLASARLCLRAELWGKARSYLETVIAIRPSPEVFKVYGRLLSQLGDTEAAADAYREGLNLVSESNEFILPLLGVDPATAVPAQPRLEDGSS
jgi:HemY protein